MKNFLINRAFVATKKLNFLKLSVLIVVLMMSIPQVMAGDGDLFIIGDEALTGHNWSDGNWDDRKLNRTFYAVQGGTWYRYKIRCNGYDNCWSSTDCCSSITGPSGTYKGTDGGNMTITLPEGIYDVAYTLTGSGWNFNIKVTESSYFIKYPWNGGSWVWSGQMASNGDGTYSVRGQYGGTSYNYGRRGYDGGAGYNGTAQTATIEGDTPSIGDYCIFTYKPSDHSLKIRKASSVSHTNYFYFDNSNAQWSQTYTYFVIGNPEYSTMYGSLNNVTNTQLKYGNNSSDDWSDVSYYAIAAGNSAWDNEHGWNYPALTGWTKRSAPYLTNLNMRNGYLYLIGKANGTNDQAITLTEKGNTASSLNSTQTIKYAVATGGTAAASASELTSGTTPATLTISSYKFTNGTYNSVGASSSPAKSITAGGNTRSTTETAAYTATTTITVSSVNAAYRFKGFYESASGGSAMTDDNENANDIVYYPKGNKTIYARFVSLYSVSYNINGGTGTLPTKGAGTHESGENVTLGNNNNSDGNGNISKTGYTLTGWNTDSEGNGDHYNLGATISAIGANKTLYAEWTPITFTVTFNANGGSGTMENQDFTYDVTENLTANAFTYAGYYFEGWALTNVGYVAYRNRVDGCNISTTNEATVELFAKWKAVSNITTDCWDGSTYKCTEITDLATPDPSVTTTTWNTATWGDGSSTPTINDQVVIPANFKMTVDVEHAKAKEIILGSGSKLIIGVNDEDDETYGLEVAGTITMANGSAPTEADLKLESCEDGNASLIFDNSNEASATVQMYSKADVSDASQASGWHWQYIGIPYTSVNALQYYGSSLYAWNGTGWSLVVNGATMTAFTGYCITNKSGAETYTTSGALVMDKTKDIELTGKFAVIGNSWTAPIQITQMDEDDFDGVDETIYLFNTGNDVGKDGESGTTAGTYRVIPIGNAGKGGLPSKISSLQGFYVQSSSTSGGSVTLNYNKHVRTKNSNTPENGAMYAPKRLENEPTILKIIADGSRFGANVLFFEREDFTFGYDAGRDGENINSAGAGPLIYTLREDGTKDAVSSIPSMEGAVVGFVKGEDNVYTMSFQYDGDDNWYLNDTKEQKSTLIASENTYMFTTSESDVAERFVISKSPIHKTPTGIDNVTEGSNARKQMINGTLYIIRDGRIYNAEGAKVK